VWQIKPAQLALSVHYNIVMLTTLEFVLLFAKKVELKVEVEVESSRNSLF